MGWSSGGTRAARGRGKSAVDRAAFWSAADVGRGVLAGLLRVAHRDVMLVGSPHESVSDHPERALS